MSDLEENLLNIKRKIELATVKKAELQHRKAMAETTESSILKQLKDKFGLDSLDTARDLLIELKKKLDVKMNEAEEKLKEAGLDS